MTALGKLKSSRNAFRHGLSIPLQSNHAGSEEIRALVKALVEGDTSEVKLLAANGQSIGLKCHTGTAICGLKNPDCR